METKDYKLFKKHNANRRISESLVQKLMTSFKNFGFINGRPILVDENMVVIDGQHRLEACKRLNIPAVYEISDAKLMEAVIALNSNQAQWKIIDYVSSYSEQGIDCYRKLLKFEEKYRFGISTSADIFMSTNQRTSYIKKGSVFSLNEQAEDVAEFVTNIRTIGFNKTRPFIKAVTYLFKKGTTAQINKIREKIILVPWSQNVAEYVTAFENILNQNKKGKNRIKL